MDSIYIVIPNWNGQKYIKECLDSLYKQTVDSKLIVVDNGSSDNSLELIKSNHPEIEIIKNQNNNGFAKAVNQGIVLAFSHGAKYIVTFNNDAVADIRMVEELYKVIKKSKSIGIATCKILDNSGLSIDSTGDFLTIWGLPFPRGRGETDLNKYDKQTEIFAASGGASMYRATMLKKIGYFDESFFAYYEDVDLSFRAQLAGWKVRFVPNAIAYHHIGATSVKIKGFATYQTMKNIPLLLTKNIPRKYVFKIAWRFMLARTLFLLRAIQMGNGVAALKGDAAATFLLFGAYIKRRKIQKSKKVSDKFIWDILVHDLPPNAVALRRLRAVYWKLLRRSNG